MALHRKYFIPLRLTAWLVMFLFAGRVSAQVTSNAGMEFWTAFPTHLPDVNDDGSVALAKFKIFITSNRASSGKVSSGTFSASFKVAANGVAEVDVPREGIYISDEEGNRVLPNRGIHIVVDPGQPPVAAYAHIYAAQRSAATLLLPVNTLGQQYYSLNYEQHRGGRSFILLVATEPDTHIRIVSPFGDWVDGGVYLKNVGDTYELLTALQATGLKVIVDEKTSACKKFAMFSGSSGLAAGVKCDFTGTLDPLFQQSPPVESWGANFGFIPFSMVSPHLSKPVRTAGQRVSIVAKEDNTVIRIAGKPVDTLKAGEVYTTYNPLTTPALIQSSKPVEVAQIAFSQACSMNPPQPEDYGSYSDPDMVLLNPFEFRIRDITLFSSNREHVREQYINVFMKTVSTPSFRINGQLPGSPFKAMPDNPDYAYLQLLVDSAQSTFHLQAEDGFNAVAYGFGNYESYAYSAGTNLLASQKITGYSFSRNLDVDSACVNEDLELRLVLPYKSPKLSWQTDENASPVIQTAPVPTLKEIDGKSFYIYHFPRPSNYSNAGAHNIRVVADYGNDNCSTGSQEIKYTFYILPLPVADFKAAQQGCGNVYRFEDKSSGAVNKYAWDFGDPSSGSSNQSSIQNPEHTFSATGTFQVRLTVTSPNGCSESRMIPVKIDVFMPAFKAANAPSCAAETLTFAAQPAAQGFIPVKWLWDFGDGSPILETASATGSHMFGAGGKYTVTLTLVNAQGCSSGTASLIVQVNPKITPAFSTSGTCIGDPFTKFINQSVSDDNAGLSYTWDFGEAGSSSNQSSLKDPTHHYNKSGQYLVSLTVTGTGGCSRTIGQTIAISDAPLAGFALKGDQPFCGSRIQLENRSKTTGTGSIEKLEIYYDLQHAPEEKITVANPQVGQLFDHEYPSSGTAQPRTFLVRIVAYSAGGCNSLYEEQVTIYPGAIVTLDPVTNLCPSSGAVQLHANILNNAAGTGVYSGKGVNSAGLFDPAAAGPGKHQLGYTFTTTIGCKTTATVMALVSDQPIVEDIEVSTVADNPVKLRPNYQGTGLTYHWEPATDLDNPNIAFPICSSLTDIQYTVTVSNGICSDDAKVSLKVTPLPVAKNTFSPNGDGVNDLWQVENLSGYPQARVSVFNRYGTLVFQASSLNRSWDGKYQGKEVPSGVYYYVIEPGGGKKAITGYVTVIR